MAETLTIRTASSTEVVKIAVPGPQGPAGQGVPVGGSTGQVLRKASGTDYDTEWAAAGSGSGSVTSVALASTDLTITGSPITSSGTITANVTVNGLTLNKLETINTAHFLGRHGSGAGDVQPVSASQARTILNVADGAEANVQSNWTEADSGSDSFILNKPSTFAPSAHSSSHASSGSDPLAPSSIGAQSLFSSGVITGASSPAAARAIIYDVMNFGSAYDITLPITNSLQGDIFVFRATNLMAANVTIKFQVPPSSPVTLGTLTAVGQQLRFTYRASAQEWTLVPVDTHEHAASAITSGTLAHERGGLEADVSAYSGLVKISGGSTSAVTITSAGEALLDDADAAAQRTTLGLGTAATAATGDFAAASHSHGNINSSGQVGSTSGLPLVTTTAGAVTTLALGTAGQVLTVNSGANGVEFAAASGGGSSIMQSIAVGFVLN